MKKLLCWFPKPKNEIHVLLVVGNALILAFYPRLAYQMTNLLMQHYEAALRIGRCTLNLVSFDGSFVARFTAPFTRTPSVDFGAAAMTQPATGREFLQFLLPYIHPHKSDTIRARYAVQLASRGPERLCQQFLIELFGLSDKMQATLLTYDGRSYLGLVVYAACDRLFLTDGGPVVAGPHVPTPNAVSRG